MTPTQTLFDFDLDFKPASSCKFKFVLIKFNDQLLVRGCMKAEYHADVVEEFQRREDTAQFQCSSVEVLGGGRIAFDPIGKAIQVYGHSIGFPWRNGESQNSLVAQMVAQAFPGFTVTWSVEGY